MMTRRLVLIAVAIAATTWTATAAIARRGRAVPSDIHTDSLRPGPDSGRVAKLLDALGKTDPVVCDLLADQLGNFWSDGGRSGLGRFADASHAVQPAKDSLHGHVRDPRAIRLLVATLASEDACVRRVSAKLLGESAVSGQTLSELLGSPQARVREAAAYASGEGERKETRPALERMLAGGASPDAAMAAWALGSIQDSVSLPVLEHAARSSDQRVRLGAVSALGSIESEHSVPELEFALKSDVFAPVRAEAAAALGNIGAARSAQVLGDALGDADIQVKYAAVRALGDLHDVTIAPDGLVRAAQSHDAQLKKLAVRALAEIHDPKTLDVLMSLVGDDDRSVRLEVVRAIGEIGSTQGKPALLRAAKDADPKVRKAAVEALGDMKSDK